MFLTSSQNQTNQLMSYNDFPNDCLNLLYLVIFLTDAV